MKARVLSNTVQVYSEPDASSPPAATLYAGQEVELGGAKKKAGEYWVKVKLSTGQEGYMTGDIQVFMFRKVSLLQDKVKVYSEPELASLPRGEFRKNDKFHIIEMTSPEWVKVRDPNGKEGYIEGKTRIKQLPVISKDVGKRNMLVGALWVIGGIVVTVLTLAAASGGGTYIVAWGAVIFGGIQFLQGLYQFATATE